MGGIAGHMAHPYNYGHFTLRDLKGLVRNLSMGRIPDITEKIDGLNLVATLNPEGEVVFIRNKTDLNNSKGGMTFEELSHKWANPAVSNTFIEAAKTIIPLIKKVGKDFFSPNSNTRIALNCECVRKGKTNIMPYTTQQVDIHNLFIYTKQNNEWVSAGVTRTGMNKIQQVCKDNIQITPNINIRPIKEKQIVGYIKKLDYIWKKDSCGENDTIDTWKRRRFEDICKRDYKWILTSESGMNYLYDRWVKKTITVHIGTIKQEYSAFNDELTKLDKGEAGKIVGEIMSPLDEFFSKFGNRIIRQCDGLLNTNNKGIVIKDLRRDLKDVIINIRKQHNNTLNQKLTRQLRRLAELGNVINPTEGIVYSYKGNLMKCTGSFASLNQILGSLKFSHK